MWAQAETIVSFLVDGRLEAVNLHRSRQQQPIAGETFVDPEMEN